MDVAEKVQFVRSTIRPMAEYTFPYITSIIGIKDEHSGEHVGSALRCVLRGQRSIVTALHVIEKARRYPRGFALSAGYGQEPFIVEGPIRFDSVGDLGVYELPDSFPQDAEAVAFWPEDRIEPSDERLSIDYLFTHGFPDQRSRFLRFGPGVVSKSLPYGAMRRLVNLPPDLQPFQFAVDFGPANMRGPGGEGAEPIDPHGLSGSPVWRIGASGRSAAEWAPEKSLVVGFLTRWRPDEQILVASSASRILPDHQYT